MNIGDKVRLKVKQMAKLNRPAFVEHKGYICNITDHIINIMYIKDGRKTYRESFDIADIIEKKAEIEVFIGGKWVEVTSKDFKI